MEYSASSLTTNIDTINVDGHAVNTVVGVEQVVGGASTGTTWNTGDTINGNGLTKINLIENGGTGNIVDANNIAAVNVNLAASSTLNELEFNNVAAVNINNGVGGQTLTVTNASQSTVHGMALAGRAFNATIGYAAPLTGTADVAALSVAGTGTATTDSVFNVVNGNAIEAVTVAVSGTNHYEVQAGTGAAKITFTGNGVNDVLISSAATTMTVDASATTGRNIIDVASLLSTTDSVLGGSGTDTLIADLDSAVQLIPTISGVEELDLTFNTAAIFNASKTTGITELEIVPVGAVNATVTNLAATATTINIGDNWNDNANTTTSGAIAIGYAAGSNSDVTLNVGTVSSTANPYMRANGNLTLTNNAGALTINSVGDAANQLAVGNTITANKVSDLTVQGLTQGLTTGDISVTNADTVTVDASLKATKVGAVAIDSSASQVTITSGAAAVETGAITQAAIVDLGTTVVYDITAGAKDATVASATIATLVVADDIDATFNLTSNGAGAVAVTNALSVDVDTNFESAINMAVNIAAAGAGAVTVGEVAIDEAASTGTSTLNLDIDAAAGNATVTTLTLTDNDYAYITASAATGKTATIGTLAGSGDITSITASGAGTVTIGDTASTYSGSADVVVDASAVTGAFVVDLNKGTGNMNVVLGNGTSLTNTVITGTGSDVITGGTGADSVTANQGNDVISTGSGVDFLYGGVGVDVMTGGAGADNFYYADGDTTVAVTQSGAVGVKEIFTLTVAGDFSAGEVITFTNVATADVTYTVTEGQSVNSIATAASAAIAAATGALYEVTGVVGGVATLQALATGAKTDATGTLTTANTGVTVATADTITDFVTGSDTLDVGVTGSATTVTIASGAALANFAAFVSAADTALDGTVLAYVSYDAVASGNAYVAVDRNRDGSFDQGDDLIVLTGINASGEFAVTDII